MAPNAIFKAKITTFVVKEGLVMKRERYKGPYCTMY
jgi:hypothetical protein